MRAVQFPLFAALSVLVPMCAQAYTPSCSANPGCEELSGDCCPASDGNMLMCCGAAEQPASASCALHADCVDEHGDPLSGNCCPHDDGSNLACCSETIGDNGDNGDSASGGGVVDAGGASGGGVVDAGGCAVDITAGIAAITSAAKNINYAVEDCPVSEAQRACADDINSAITDFSAAANAIESATYTCGGIDTTCAMDITNAITSLSASSETLIVAASDCEKGRESYDPFACVVDVFDVVDTLTHCAKSIYDAVDHCEPKDAKQPCVKTTAGQTQIVVADCVGTGCNANGDDQDCAWCVTDMQACSEGFGEDKCQATMNARQAQDVSC